MWPFDLFQQTPMTEEPPKKEVAQSEYDGAFGVSSTIFEKYRGDDLLDNRGNGVYRDMLRDDQVEAAMTLVNAAITGRRWSFEIDDPDVQQEVADLFEYNLTRIMHGTVKQLLSFMLTARVEGFSLVEKVFGSFEYEGSQWWGLDNFKLRPPETFTFDVDKFGNVQNVLQYQDDQAQQKIALERFIHTVNKPELDLHFGRSALFPAYDHYWAKINTLRFWNIFTERVGGGFVVANVDGGLDTVQATNLQSVLKNLHTSTGIIAPKNVAIEMVMPNDPGTFENHLKFRNMAIARALLLPSLLGFGEETDTGSQARAQSQLELWFWVIDQMAANIADTLNEQLFRELCVWNFGHTNAPLFVLESLTTEQKKQFAEQWIAAIAGGAVQNTFEDEIRLREMLHFPAREEEDIDVQAPIEEEPIEQPELEDGINPISTATSMLKSAAEVINPDYSHRADLDTAKNVVYGDAADEVGRILHTAMGDAFKQLVDSIEEFADGGFDSISGLQVDPTIVAKAEDDLFDVAWGVFQAGQESGAYSLNVARSDQRQFQLAFNMPHATSAASHFAKAEVKQNYAMDINTAEEFVRIQLFESIRGMVDDRVLMAVRQAIINGLASDQSVEQMIENAGLALQPYIGQIDSEGNVITEEGLPARVSTATNTILTKIYNEGLRSFFEAPEQNGFVEAYQYSAVLDQRTTQFCRRANGKIWPIESGLWTSYIPPNHFNCRSIILPVVVGDEWTESPNVPETVSPSPGFG